MAEGLVFAILVPVGVRFLGGHRLSAIGVSEATCPLLIRTIIGPQGEQETGWKTLAAARQTFVRPAI